MSNVARRYDPATDGLDDFQLMLGMVGCALRSDEEAALELEKIAGMDPLNGLRLWLATQFAAHLLVLLHGGDREHALEDYPRVAADMAQLWMENTQ